MKLSISFLLAFIFLINTYGQPNFPPCVAFDSTGKDTIRAINSHSNSLYAGIDNQVEINKKNVPFKNIIVECYMGMVMEDEGYYDIIPAKVGTTVISIYQYDKGDTVLYFKKTMNVKRLPQPYITLDKVKLTDYPSISKQILLKKKSFEVHLSDDIIDDNQWFSVKEITIGYQVGQLYVTKSCEGAELPEDLLQIIEKLTPGTEVSFVFTITGSGDVFKRMPPLKFKIY